MNENYLGTVLTEDARTAVLNEEYLCLYLTLLAASTHASNPETYIRRIETNVRRTFGDHLSVAFLAEDTQELVTTVDKGQPFYLAIDIRETNYYSKEVH